jgi:phosphonate transport system substrate-binding protein
MRYREPALSFQPGVTQERSRSEKISKYILLIIGLLVPLILLSCKKSDEETVSVDFTDRVHMETVDSSLDGPRFTIAVAAMVSPKETLIYYDRMMRYVSRKYDRPVEFVQKKTYQEVNDLLYNKKIDLAFVCSGPYVKGHEKFGMELLVAPKLYGKAFYQAYFIVHNDSTINDLQGLRGKRFAFTDPASNTGKLVPTYVLAKMNQTPEEYFGDIIFTYSHDNSIKAVAKKIVDGASIDGLIWDYYHDRKPDIVSKTKIIYRSPLYGIPPVVVHPDMPAPAKEKLRNIFLEMHKDPAGMKILSELKIEQFIVPENSSYDSVREMRQWLKDRP